MFNKPKSALILFPHQLYPLDQLPKVDRIYLVEEPLIFGHDKERPTSIHIQKLILHRASMRRYVEEVLWPAKINVEYIETNYTWWSGKAITRASMDGCTTIYLFDPTDEILSERLVKAQQELPKATEVKWFNSPNFYLTAEEVRKYFKNKSTVAFDKFYQWQREHFGILLTKSFKPVGGQWQMPETKPAKIPLNHKIPQVQAYGTNKYVKQARQYITKKFNHYHGDDDEFFWPTSATEAEAWLEDFLDNKLNNYARYSHAVEAKNPFLHHSVLSPLLNIGLLNPQEVIDKTFEYHLHKPYKLEDLELFVRDLLGWREYLRAQYLVNQERWRQANMFDNRRQLTSHWYEAKTGLDPVDDCIIKAHKYAYLNDQERLVLVGGAMLMARFDPNLVYKWFMEMTIDAYDWVVVPATYGMSQYANGDVILSRPALVTSKYITQISHYQADDWSETWDGLYWQFIADNRLALEAHSVSKDLVKSLEKVNDNKLRVLGYRAGDFLASRTK